MAAILQTRGVLVTPAVIKSNCNFLHMMSTHQFIKAAQGLVELNLGILVNVSPKHGQPSKVFVKKPPEEVQGVLAMNSDLCSPDFYAERYLMPSSKMITLKVRYRVAEMRVCPEKLLLQ